MTTTTASALGACSHDIRYADENGNHYTAIDHDGHVIAAALAAVLIGVAALI